MCEVIQQPEARDEVPGNMYLIRERLGKSLMPKRNQIRKKDGAVMCVCVCVCACVRACVGFQV